MFYISCVKYGGSVLSLGGDALLTPPALKKEAFPTALVIPATAFAVGLLILLHEGPLRLESA